MTSSPSDWVGSVYLYIQSDSTSLPAQYDSCRASVYAALSKALTDVSRVSTNSLEILKINRGDRELILHLKFCGQETCKSFLQDYRERRIHQHLQNQLGHCLTMGSLIVHLELKVDGEKLDTILENENQCLRYIFSLKPSYQKDDELAELDRNLMQLSLCSVTPQNSNSPSSQGSSLCPSSQGSPPHTLRSGSSEGNTFRFLGQEYVDRPLTAAHHQLFANSVGRSWKKVGRTLKKDCRALRDPAIENLAFEHEKEGLYEQAYQMLRRFIDCEGRKATLQRLVDALVDNELNGIAEDLLALPENELK
ncbi:tumor necrosis factor receptor type 1-associated DEATH domain protein [Pseudophryne corroboree]|uniref:tumor necrosis factor receptor type 1-associated DEATH domain protein n=1 Tax=Pseudophryne corroboree TaxID=495146 RepID=UPI0030815EC1